MMQSNEINQKFQKIYKIMLICTERGHNDLKNTPNIFKGKGVGKNATEGYGYGTLLEMCIYLLARLDVSIFQHKQRFSTRSNLINFIVSKLVENFGKYLEQENLIKVIDCRMEAYGKCFRESKEKIWEDLHFILLNNIRHTQKNNKLEIWNSNTGPLILTGIFENMTMKTSLIAFEKYNVMLFEGALKHLFQNNEDFTTLSLNEIDKRMIDGVKDAQSVLKENTGQMDEEQPIY